ncbi:MAG: DUF418 domain-containing protein [Magnetococcales bacterium]|nr:DUF418 domain-containing protein [Magnetococcales bacterium]
MNIQGMGLIEAAYGNPMAQGALSGLDEFLWLVGRVVADNRFIAIFSLLFGVGIALQGDRHDAAGIDATRMHLRRMGWLLLFGAIHGVLVWYGDILVTYVVCGLFVFWLRRVTPGALLVVAIVLLLVPTLMASQAQNTLSLAPPVVQEYLSALYWTPSTAVVRSEVNDYLGPWAEQTTRRLDAVGFMLGHLLPTLNFWKSSALMLIGMALYRLGVFGSQEHSPIPGRLVIWGVSIGVLVGTIGLYQDYAHGWHISFSLHTGRIWLYWSGLFMGVGYVGGMVWMLNSNRLTRIKGRMMAVGRMALSNYIAQSLLGSLIFYGHGLGRFNAWSLGELFLLTVVIWVSQLLWSPWWLARFRYGPLEWVWRSLTLWQRQPFRRQSS